MAFGNKQRFYGKIDIEFDSNKKEKQVQVVTGDDITISSLVGALIHNLLESGFDREMLEYAICKGLNDTKVKKAKIEVKEIHISKENEEEFKKFLDKVLKGE